MELPDPPSLHHVHHLLWECYAGMQPVSDAAFEASDLTLALAGTLDLIGLAPGATVSDLARMQPKTQQALSQLVAKLEKLGYVERRLGSGRGVGLFLTPAGEQARDDSQARERWMEERLGELLGPEAFETLRTALELVRPRFRDIAMGGGV